MEQLDIDRLEDGEPHAHGTSNLYQNRNSNRYCNCDREPNLDRLPRCDNHHDDCALYDDVNLRILHDVDSRDIHHDCHPPNFDKHLDH